MSEEVDGRTIGAWLCGVTRGCRNEGEGERRRRRRPHVVFVSPYAALDAWSITAAVAFELGIYHMLIGQVDRCG
jgi:hypothetical protein